MNWNSYQKDIFLRAKEQDSHLLIEGVAGCGKTTTIENIASEMPKEDKIIFLAHNKAIAEELARRIPNTECRTFNSIGFQVLRENMGWTKVNGRKIQNIFRYEFMNFDKADSKKKKLITTHSEGIARIIGLLKSQKNPNVSGSWEEIAESFGIDTPDKTLCKEAIPFCWQSSLSAKKVIDFDDQLFLPIYNNWDFPLYHHVIVDECQDLNEIQREIILKLAGIKSS